jgi:hypothetical protein
MPIDPSPGTFAIVILAAHLLADFPFQTDWMARNKGDVTSAYFAHLAVHAIVTIPPLYLLDPTWGPPIGAFVVLFHGLIDIFETPFDPKSGFESYPIWCDQALHVATIAVSIVMYQVSPYT